MGACPPGNVQSHNVSVQSHNVQQAGEGGGFMGWVIRIIFDPNTRQWRGWGVMG